MSSPMRPFRRDPLATIEAMRDRLNRLLGDAFTGYRGRTPLWHPDIEVEDRDDATVIEVRLPGVAPDEVAVDVTGRDLLVRAVHAEGDSGDATETAPRSAVARRYADFSYRLTLPPDADPDSVDATMDHGLLTITVPRSRSTGSRRVSIGRRTIEGQPTAEA